MLFINTINKRADKSGNPKSYSIWANTIREHPLLRFN